MIRLKKVKFINFKIFKNTTGKSTIEFDIPNKYNLIVLRGRNGSGKSTLLSCITPSARTNVDDVEDFKDGYKELTYVDDVNKKEYILKFLYTPKGKKTAGHTVKSFFTVKSFNGEETELNPTGLQSSFEEIKYQMFGVNNDLMKLLNTGINNTGIINMSTSDRRKYLYSLIKELDIVDKYTKTAGEKFRDLDRDLKGSTNKLSKLPEMSYIDTQINLAKRSLETEEKGLAEMNMKIGSLKGTFDIQVATNKLNGMKKTKHDMDIVLDIYKRNMFKNDCPISEIYFELVNDNNEAKSRLKVNEENVIQLQNKLYDLKNKRTVDTSIDYKSEIANVERMYRALEPYKNIETKYGNLSLDEINLCKHKLTKIVSVFDRYENVNRSKVKDILCDSLEVSHSEYDKFVHKLSRMTDDLQELKRRADYLTQLKMDMREYNDVSKCDATHPCTFKRKYDDKLKEISELDGINKTIMDNSAIVVNMVEEKDEFEAALNCADKLQEMLNVVEGYSELKIIFNNIRDELINSFVDKSYESYLSVIDEISINVSNHIEFNSISNRLEELRHLQMLVSKDSKSIDNEIKRIENELVHCSDERCSLNSRIRSAEDMIRKINFDNSNSYMFMNEKTINEKLTIVNSEIESLEKEISDNENITQVIHDLNFEIDNCKNRIVELNELITKYSIEKNTVDSLKQEVETLTTEHTLVKYVRDVLRLDLPSFVIGEMLLRVQNLANDFLSISDSVYKINDCIVNSEEFKIQISNRGFINEDTAILSSGEKAIISLAFTFALVHILMKDFRILTFDELDATLDNSNREKFVDILLRQISVFNIPQIFMVTHNDMFINHINDIGVIALSEIDDRNIPEENIIAKIYK